MIYYISMPYRKNVLASGEIYHVFNRGIDSRPVFADKRDYQRFLETSDFYRYSKPLVRLSHYHRLLKEHKGNIPEKLRGKGKPLVTVLVFCLMPNHFHFLLKQLEDRGISIFMRNFQNSYARYFNTRHQRIGSLFISPFKAVRVESEEQLLHVSRYIHLNPVSSFLIDLDGLDTYPWSSFPEYLNKQAVKYSDPTTVLSYFAAPEAYRKFVRDQADYQKRLELIKRLTFE